MLIKVFIYLLLPKLKVTVNKIIKYQLQLTLILTCEIFIIFVHDLYGAFKKINHIFHSESIPTTYQKILIIKL